jgi:hypothetical protein
MGQSESAEYCFDSFKSAVRGYQTKCSMLCLPTNEDNCAYLNEEYSHHDDEYEATGSRVHEMEIDICAPALVLTRYTRNNNQMAEIEQIPLDSCRKSDWVVPRDERFDVVKRPRGMLRKDCPEIDEDEPADETEPPEVCNAVETAADEAEPPEVCNVVETPDESIEENTQQYESIEVFNVVETPDESVDSRCCDQENPQQIVKVSDQMTGEMIRQNTFETDEDDMSERPCNSESHGEAEFSRQGSPRSTRSRDWDLVDIAEPEHEEEQEKWDLVDLDEPEQDNEECKPPHSTMQSEEQALLVVAKDGVYLNRSSDDIWEVMDADGPDLSETPDKEECGPPSRILARGEQQPMADMQCIKSGTQNEQGGKHSPDTGGTDECMGVTPRKRSPGADTGGFKSCGSEGYADIITALSADQHHFDSTSRETTLTSQIGARFDSTSRETTLTSQIGSNLEM